MLQTLQYKKSSMLIHYGAMSGSRYLCVWGGGGGEGWGGGGGVYERLFYTVSFIQQGTSLGRVAVSNTGSVLSLSM